jgi:ABC-type multidrug transport system permease subunit
VNPAINDWGTIDYSWLIMVFIMVFIMVYFMVYFMEKPKQKWMMMTGSTPMDWKPPYD